MALLPFHLQFTVSSRSEIWRWSLGLLIPLDPQKNTWCSYELLSVLFQLWVFAKALKPKIKCPQAGGQQEALELWAGQRSPTPTWPRALLGCHESQRWWTAPNLLLSSDPNFLVTNTGLPGNAGLKGRVPGQTVTLIHCRLREMLNFFGFQVLSKIRLGHDLHKYPLWLWRSHVVISVCASHELRTKTGPGWPGLFRRSSTSSLLTGDGAEGGSDCSLQGVWRVLFWLCGKWGAALVAEKEPQLLEDHRQTLPEEAGDLNDSGCWL